MSAQRVLDCEIVQSEALLHRAQQRLIRLVQADSDEATVGGVNLARLIEIDVRDPASGVAGGIDHHTLLRIANPGFGSWPMAPAQFRELWPTDDRPYCPGLTAAPANLRGRFFAVNFGPLFCNDDDGEERTYCFPSGPYTTMDREERIPPP
jgi:hypothetical protein